MPADEGLEKLRAIAEEFGAFCDVRGAVSEADTRAKVIDRVLKEVLEWPESTISREDRSERGFIDYSLTLHTRPLAAVEAKREGIAFTIPETWRHPGYKISGALYTDQPIREAIEQVRSYCDDSGIRYAVATNGYAWIVFRALREDMPWRDGRAKVFPSLDYIA
jgi:hypothetical protein